MYVVYIWKCSSARARGASVVWHHSLLLMNSFNKTVAAVFSCRLCFLRAFPFISLIIPPHVTRRFVKDVWGGMRAICLFSVGKSTNSIFCSKIIHVIFARAACDFFRKTSDTTVLYWFYTDTFIQHMLFMQYWHWSMQTIRFDFK